MDNGDAGDAHGHIDTACLPVGGRKVGGSNPVVPLSKTAAIAAVSALISQVTSRPADALHLRDLALLRRVRDRRRMSQ